MKPTTARFLSLVMIAMFAFANIANGKTDISNRVFNPEEIDNGIYSLWSTRINELYDMRRNNIMISSQADIVNNVITLLQHSLENLRQALVGWKNNKTIETEDAVRVAMEKLLKNRSVIRKAIIDQLPESLFRTTLLTLIGDIEDDIISGADYKSANIARLIKRR